MYCIFVFVWVCLRMFPVFFPVFFYFFVAPPFACCCWGFLPSQHAPCEHPWLELTSLPLLTKSCFCCFLFVVRAHVHAPQRPSVTLLASFRCSLPLVCFTATIGTHKYPQYACNIIPGPLSYVFYVPDHFTCFAMWCMVCLRACLVYLCEYVRVFIVCICVNPNPEHTHLCFCPFASYW